jgi:hypothetical protein
VAGAALGPCIHFLPVLLIFKDDSDIVGEAEQVWVGEFEDAAGLGSEHDATHPSSFGPARSSGLCVLTGPHGKEKCPKDKVGSVGISGDSLILGATCQELE